MAWDPVQYGRFAAERAQPFHDLCDLIRPDRPVRRAVDLGCGTGELTGHAFERFDVVDGTGVDSSPAMLAVAAGFAHERLRFVIGDLGAWTSDADHDLVLANASLQWVPDHPGVLARWARALAPGGWLAVQVPANAHHSSHVAAADVARAEPFRSALGGEPPPDPVAANVLPPARYATVLHRLGLVDVHVRLQVYLHELADTAAVVDWARGTTLNRFAERLPDDVFDDFVAAYRRELIDREGDRSPYLFTFERILIRARRP